MEGMSSDLEIDTFGFRHAPGYKNSPYNISYFLNTVQHNYPKLRPDVGFGCLHNRVKYEVRRTSMKKDMNKFHELFAHPSYIFCTNG